MKIAQVAPLYESVPPKLYGGTERVVSYLTKELVRQGHDVTLFASGDSTTEARLVPICEQSLRLDKDCIDQLAHHIRMLNAVFERASEFDILHFHIDYLHYPLSMRQKIPHLTTLHGRLDLPDLQPLYRDFKAVPLVSISNAQRSPIPWANWRATVYHGLPEDLYVLESAQAAGRGDKRMRNLGEVAAPGESVVRESVEGKAGDYLAFIGRISPEKRVDRAIEIARRTGRRLRIAAKVDDVDEKYFHEQIEPLLGQPGIEFIGEIGEEEKQEFLGGAAALLLPIDWPEPFGLVMIEAMACGVPTIVWNEGSAPEIIDHGVTGFVVESIEEAASSVESALALDRRAIRKVFERRFTAGRMARDYIRVYESLIESGATQVAA